MPDFPSQGKCRKPVPETIPTSLKEGLEKSCNLFSVKWIPFQNGFLPEHVESWSPGASDPDIRRMPWGPFLFRQKMPKTNRSSGACDKSTGPNHVKF